MSGHSDNCGQWTGKMLTIVYFEHYIEILESNPIIDPIHSSPPIHFTAVT